MARTALITHAACLRHLNPPAMPESAARLSYVLKALDAPDFSGLLRLDAPRATPRQLERVHSGFYLDEIEGLTPARGFASLDEDTFLSPGSFEAALRAAGAGCHAVDEIMSGRIDRAFCAVRPPGHHARAGHAMGFCIFSNIALAAAHAIETYGVRKIAIIDFDVHHGNGTQEWAEDHPDVLFVSSHEFPQWPGTGHADDSGPHGNIVNLPLPTGTDGAALLRAYEAELFPRVRAHEPELIFISAGFDAHKDDPLAGLALDEKDYGRLTSCLLKLAIETPAQGRVISILEGGYNLDALAASSAHHVRALMAG